ncbi:MAG: hypothetical protein IJ150_10965 [Bacteroidales bacterium]|nr:hypothetical protein [Bacteroidales bacterium]
MFIWEGGVYMHNLEIRQALKSARIFGYEVAASLGITESSFSKRLTRRELTTQEKERIYQIIKEIKGEVK